MKVVHALKEDYSLKAQNGHKIFLAGGCMTPWREDLKRFCLGDSAASADFVLFDPYIEEADDWNEVVVWEHRHLQEADTIVFWFTAGSANPMSLFELGRYIKSGKNLVIGIDPEYEKRDSVYTQIKLALPEQHICESIISLFDELTDIY